MGNNCTKFDGTTFNMHFVDEIGTSFVAITEEERQRLLKMYEVTKPTIMNGGKKIGKIVLLKGD